METSRQDAVCGWRALRDVLLGGLRRFRLFFTVFEVGVEREENCWTILINELWLSSDNMKSGVGASTLEQIANRQEQPVGSMRLSPDAVESWSSIMREIDAAEGVSEDLFNFDFLPSVRDRTITADSSPDSQTFASSIDMETVLEMSEGGSVWAGSIDASVVLCDSEGGSVRAASIDAGSVLLDSEGGSVWAGSIDATNVLWDSEGGSVYATSIQSSDLLRDCSQSYVVAEKVVSASIGQLSEGSLLVAETVQGDIHDGVEVVSGEPGLGLTYRGEWDSLREYIGSYLDSRDLLLEALGPFTLQGEADTVEAVHDEFDEIESLYEEDEIREGYSVFDEFEDVLGLGLDGSNQKRAEKLRNIDDIVQREVQSQYDVKDSNVDGLWDTSHLGYVLEKEDKIESRVGGLDAFVETFHGGSDTYADMGFEVEYHFDPDDLDGLTADTRERNEELYDKGVELIEQVRDGNTGGFDIRDDEYDRKQEELASLSERIDAAFSDGDTERGQALIKDRQGLETEVACLANEYQEEVLENMGMLQPGTLSLGELREGLNQLYQEHLEEDSTVYRRARKVANNIETEAAAIGDVTVSHPAWGKGNRNLPLYGDYQDLIFPGAYDEMNR